MENQIQSPTQPSTSSTPDQTSAPDQPSTPHQPSTPDQPSTSSARPQRRRELPARLRDPDQIVEMPGQAVPTELTKALELIKTEETEGWRVAHNKTSRRRLNAISAIKTQRDLIKLIAKYRRYAEPEPKWSTQEWVNFILHGDPQHTAPPYRFYRTVEIDLSAPTPAPGPAPAPAPAPALAPVPPINQNADTPPADLSNGSDNDEEDQPPTPSAPLESDTESLDTPNSNTETDVSAQAWVTPSASLASSPASGSQHMSPRPSAPPDPDGSPPGTAVRPATSTGSASCQPTTSGTSGTGRSIPISTTPAQDAAGVLRRKEGSYTVSYVPESVARPSMADRMEGLRRNEPPRFATRRRLEREGLVLPDDILHEYLPTRKSRKK